MIILYRRASELSRWKYGRSRGKSNYLPKLHACCAAWRPNCDDRQIAHPSSCKRIEMYTSKGSTLGVVLRLLSPRLVNLKLMSLGPSSINVVCFL